MITQADVQVGGTYEYRPSGDGGWRKVIVKVVSPDALGPGPYVTIDDLAYGYKNRTISLSWFLANAKLIAAPLSEEDKQARRAKGRKARDAQLEAIGFLYRPIPGHPGGTDLKLLGAVRVRCGCGWSETVRHRNALARRAKADGAYHQHRRDAYTGQVLGRALLAQRHPHLLWVLLDAWKKVS